MLNSVCLVVSDLKILNLCENITLGKIIQFFHQSLVLAHIDLYFEFLFADISVFNI